MSGDFDVDFDETPAPPAKPASPRLTPPPPPPPESIGQGADAEVTAPRHLPALAVRQPAPRINKPDTHRNGTKPDRTPPNSKEAEQHILACCMVDASDTLARCQESGITEDSFYSPANRLLYSVFVELKAAGKPTDLAVVVQELQNRKQLDAIGGMPYLMEVTNGVYTTALAGYFITQLSEKHRLRELIKAAGAAVEKAYAGGTALEISAEAENVFKSLTIGTAKSKVVAFTDYEIPPDDDASVLLGLRYLNRGDGMILTSSSGVGKSSMSLQMAVHWALGRPCFGIPANGRLKIIIIQSEDSDGDIAEVWASIEYKMKLSKEEIEIVRKNVLIVSDRVSRGERFLHRTRRLIVEHNPDLVIINPLQAFIDGDVTESKDLGDFLREGLNSMNEPVPRFGWIIVHHTTKPASGKDKQERQWHEVMYDMAGGAELINWARAIMSLRACETEGDFQLVLAKRGKRAGVTKLVGEAPHAHYEAATKISLRHSKESIQLKTRKRPLSVIYWEDREDTPVDPEAKAGRKPSRSLEEIRPFIPTHNQPPIPLPRIVSKITDCTSIPRNTARSMVIRAKDDGLLEIVPIAGGQHGFRFKL